MVFKFDKNKYISIVISKLIFEIEFKIPKSITTKYFKDQIK